MRPKHNIYFAWLHVEAYRDLLELVCEAYACNVGNTWEPGVEHVNCTSVSI